MGVGGFLGKKSVPVARPVRSGQRKIPDFGISGFVNQIDPLGLGEHLIFINT